MNRTWVKHKRKGNRKSLLTTTPKISPKKVGPLYLLSLYWSLSHITSHIFICASNMCCWEGSRGLDWVVLGESFCYRILQICCTSLKNSTCGQWECKVLKSLNLSAFHQADRILWPPCSSIFRQELFTSWSLDLYIAWAEEKKLQLVLHPLLACFKTSCDLL